jgi:pyruvate dehydrogenase E2 component (dihydrolipoamide acetyltransferase)
MSADAGEKLSPLQRMTIERLEQAAREAVAVTLLADARGESLLEARRICAGHEVPVTITALLAAILAKTAADHQEINSSISDGRLHHHDAVALGIAVALPDGGLSVPIVQRANELPLAEVAARINELAARARAGELTRADVRGGVITLSSIGMHGGRIYGTPVIPPQQTAIVLAAAVTAQPVVEDGRLAVGQVLPLSLAFDHRVLNGEAAVHFLTDFVRRIESAAQELDPSA